LLGVELIQTRFVTNDVAALARHYSALVGASSPLNDYYVELPTGATTVGFSRCRFTEDIGIGRGEVILDFVVPDVDAAYPRIDALGVHWLFGPTTQPWGRRSMMLRDPEGHLINIVSDPQRNRS
jgi:catechol 2,3-dioxygenase-like lactoylglutathione lyase family enzyme